MDKEEAGASVFEDSIFEKNLAALGQANPLLASRVADSRLRYTGQARGSIYRFRESRSGETVPVWTADGRPLHSLFDPAREAKRLMDSSGGAGSSGARSGGASFIVLLGLGGVCHCGAALEREETECLLVLEYNVRALAELLGGADYSGVFGDPRFHIFADLSPRETEEVFLDLYKPALYGGLKTIPLRSRLVFDGETFGAAAAALERAVEKVGADYSVQAHFGTRWFSNILKNLEAAGPEAPPLPAVKKAAVCGAGPSLDAQIPSIKKRRNEFFLIAADTAFPALMSAAIKPDAVISIDCQHISYYHFMETLPDETLLFLDLASPPLAASRAARTCFFSGGHPLCRYISQTWRPFPAVDTSGGNVTYAAVSLAAALGAVSIELYGADFSYPRGLSYARGTYIHGLFQNRQTRLNSLENLYSTFLYRTPIEKKGTPPLWYYETTTLKFYREYLESQNPGRDACLLPAEGGGAPITISRTKKSASSSAGKTEDFSSAKSSASLSPRGFLLRYREKIKNLPSKRESRGGPEKPRGGDPAVLNTLLPAMAAIRRGMEDAEAKSEKIIEELKRYCVKKIDSVLARLD